MTDAATSGFLTRHVLENPWPLGLILLAVGLALGWTGLREGLSRRVRIAAGLALAGTAIIAIGQLVATAGEQAERITRQLVEAAVAEDVLGGLALFADDAMMTTGSPQNPGFGLESITAAFQRLAENYDIDANSITRLTGATVSSDEGESQLSCLTTVSQFPYPNSSQWIVRVRRTQDGEWRITRLTCIDINDQTPPLDRIW